MSKQQPIGAIDGDKLLKFLYANYEENKLSQAGKALDYVIKKIGSSDFMVE